MVGHLISTGVKDKTASFTSVLDKRRWGGHDRRRRRDGDGFGFGFGLGLGLRCRQDWDRSRLALLGLWDWLSLLHKGDA